MALAAVLRRGRRSSKLVCHSTACQLLLPRLTAGSRDAQFVRQAVAELAGRVQT